MEWMLNRDIQESLMDAIEHLSETCELPKRLMSVPVNVSIALYLYLDSHCIPQQGRQREPNVKAAPFSILKIIT